MVPRDPFRIRSARSNPLVRCNGLPALNLAPWRERPCETGTWPLEKVLFHPLHLLYILSASSGSTFPLFQICIPLLIYSVLWQREQRGCLRGSCVCVWSCRLDRQLQEWHWKWGQILSDVKQAQHIQSNQIFWWLVCSIAMFLLTQSNLFYWFRSALYESNESMFE